MSEDIKTFIGNDWVPLPPEPLAATLSNGWLPCVYRRRKRDATKQSGNRAALCEQIHGHTMRVAKGTCERCTIRHVVRPRPRQERRHLPPSAPEKAWLESLGVG